MHSQPANHTHTTTPHSTPLCHPAPPPPRRSYILNLKCADFSPEHLWQMRIVTPAARWTTVALPFDELMLTQRGRVELEQREINRDSINGVRPSSGVGAGSCGGIRV